MDMNTPADGSVKAVFGRLRSKLTTQRQSCDAVDSWVKPVARGFSVPRNAAPEHRALADLARTPWLRLIVDNVAQAMYVDRIVDSNGTSDELWRLWHANGLQSSQISLHRCFVTYGHAYSVVTPAVSRGVDTAKIRFMSPRRVAVEFADPGASLYPSAALEATSDHDGGTRYVLHLPGVSMDVVERSADEPVVVGETKTDLDVVPVIRFANQVDLDGNVSGEVTPFIPTAQRINKTSYDRLLAQHYNSWKVKYATGVETPRVPSTEYEEDGTPYTFTPDDAPIDEAATEKVKMKLAQDDVLLLEDVESRVGTLDATALDPFVNSWRSDIEALAAVSQTPAHALTGQLVNLSAEALAAARAPLTQKVTERQVSANLAYSLTLRLAASLAGLDELAADDFVRVTWQDMEIRSMSQAVDALGKAKTMLDIPARGLWSRIPGVEASDLQEWDRMAEEDRDTDPVNRFLTKGAEPTGVTSGEDAPEGGE